MRGRDDRGQALPLVLAAVTLVVLAGIGIAAAGVEQVHRHQAQTAADAVALAGLESAEAAQAAAAANGAVLLRLSVVLDIEGRPRWVSVEVERAGERAVARASREP